MALTTLVLAAAFALQPTGTFHGGESVARDGERWLALQPRTNGAELVSTTVRVQHVNDVVADGPDDRTGEEVSIAGGNEDRVVLLLRGTGLRAGQVTVARPIDPPKPLSDDAIDLPLGRTASRLRMQCTGATCRLVLTTGARAQTLLSMGGRRGDEGRLELGDDASPTLLFAGDLDRDGKLDLILQTSDHYNVSRPTLYLSSQARRGELVHAVAVHDSVGC